MTQSSSRLLAAELGMSNVKVADVWRERGLQPRRAEGFKFSTDPRLEAKVRDVVGLYLNPPDKAIVLATLERPPKRLGVTHWSSRLLGAELGISNVKVADVWREWGLQPWRTESFKFSTDPQLEAKVRDVTGLYLNPPDKAVVLCVDEKPQTQALERKAPVLAIRPGIPEKRSHDYIRHGTTALFAALEAATGKVTGACYPQHRHEEFLTFLKQVAKTYPRVPLHIVCDNYGTHNHPAVRAWLARHPRITLHFTPTSGSWLNLVEVFFIWSLPGAVLNVHDGHLSALAAAS